MDNIKELADLSAEKIRQEKQIVHNADVFTRLYFGHRSYSVQKAVKKTYLKIVRDKILF